MSEHNQQDQKVGSQYNADAINIHNHAASPDVPHLVEQTRQALQEFKDRFATNSISDLRLRLLEVEDLLIHIVGKERYVSLIQDAEFIEVKLAADHMEDVESHGKTRPSIEQAIAAWKALKARIAGIEYRNPSVPIPDHGSPLGLRDVTVAPVAKKVFVRIVYSGYFLAGVDQIEVSFDYKDVGVGSSKKGIDIRLNAHPGTHRLGLTQKNRIGEILKLNHHFIQLPENGNYEIRIGRGFFSTDFTVTVV
jgi:hypothetical protein